jgi:hypothetical protein
MASDLPEDEDADPVGAPPDRDPVARFQAIAMELGLAGGAQLDQKLIDFAFRVVDLCAAIGDQYQNPDVPEDTVGDHIRAELYD